MIALRHRLFFFLPLLYAIQLKLPLNKMVFKVHAFAGKLSFNWRFTWFVHISGECQVIHVAYVEILSWLLTCHLCIWQFYGKLFGVFGLWNCACNICKIIKGCRVLGRCRQGLNGLTKWFWKNVTSFLAMNQALVEKWKCAKNFLLVFVLQYASLCQWPIQANWKIRFWDFLYVLMKHHLLCLLLLLTCYVSCKAFSITWFSYIIFVSLNCRFKCSLISHFILLHLFSCSIYLLTSLFVHVGLKYM